jgi:hypothetical protein
MTGFILTRCAAYRDLSRETPFPISGPMERLDGRHGCDHACEYLLKRGERDALRDVIEYEWLDRFRRRACTRTTFFAVQEAAHATELPRSGLCDGLREAAGTCLQHDTHLPGVGPDTGPVWRGGPEATA